MRYYFTAEKPMSSTVAVVLIVGSMLMFVGCAATPCTIFEFKESRIFLHVYEEPAKVKSELTAEGPRIQARQELGNANADFIITGSGTVQWEGYQVEVKNDSIDINGVAVVSKIQGYRNVTIAKDGTVQKDRFIPFEPPWGYHPRPIGN